VVKLVTQWFLVLMVIGEWWLQHNALSATRCISSDSSEQWAQTWVQTAICECKSEWLPKFGRGSAECSALNELRCTFSNQPPRLTQPGHPGKVTVDLASHWPCTTHNSGLLTCGLNGLCQGDEHPTYASSEYDPPLPLPFA